jgi:DNA-binding MarR family transcriptional regulator
LDSALPKHSFGLLVTEVGRLLQNEFDRRVKGHGFTRAQWSVIVYLSRNEGTSQAALADIMDVEPISLVPLLDKLQSGGYVERQPNPTDRRANQLFLTEKARPLLETLADISVELRAEALEGLSDKQHEALLEMLLNIKANLTNKPVDDLRRAVGHE